MDDSPKRPSSYSSIHAVPSVSSLKSARLHLLVGLALLLFPAWKSGGLVANYLSQGFDVTLTTAGLFLGITWHLWRFLNISPPKDNRWDAWLWLGLLCLTTWQLAWIGAGDFWFLRLSLVGLIFCWLCILWGWSGLLHGWRALIAAGLWAIWCDGEFTLGPPSFAAWLSEVTSQLAAWGLWVFGKDVLASGNALTIEGQRLTVGLPCTAIPLITLTWLLCILAGLLMRLRLLQMLGLLAFTAVLGFFISIVRVMLLALVLGDEEVFHYWHFGGGGSWFTALAMVVLAWLLSLMGHRLPPIRSDTQEVVFQSSALRYAAPVILLAGCAGLWFDSPATILSAGERQAASWAEVDLILWKPRDISTPEALPSNRFATDDRAVYVDRLNGGRLEVFISYVPVMISGDPRKPEDVAKRLRLDIPWLLRKRNGRQELWDAEVQGRRIWLATLDLEGRSFATKDSWIDWQWQNFRRFEQWWNWWLHKKALRDKRAYWVSVIFFGDTRFAEETLDRAFTNWTQHLTFKESDSSNSTP